MPHPYRYLRKVEDSPGVSTKGEAITGTGSVETAVNAYCFSGPHSDGGCRMCIDENTIAYVGYEDVVYRYFGPTEVCIGSGGAGGKYPHYVTQSTDWVATGTTSHGALTGRDVVDSHPQGAIGGRGSAEDLVADQAAQDALMSSHVHTGGDGTAQVSHQSLLKRYTADQHRIANITDLESRLTAIEDELARLESDKLDTADALAVFCFAAYANLKAPPNQGFANLGGAWEKIDILTETAGVVAPRGIIVDRPNSSFSFAYDGVYRLTLTGSFEHNSSNGGRITYIRIFNETTGTGAEGLALGTGRNAEATTVSASLIAEISEAQKGDVFSFQIGNGDSYSAVSFQTIGVAVNAISEWREPIAGAGG